MKRYARYKPSGIAWLGALPAHWEVKRIKYIVSCNDDVLSENTPEDTFIEYVEISDVDEVSGIKATQLLRFKEAPSRARRLVRNADILVSTVRTYLRAIAVVIEPPENLVVSTGFAVLRPQTVHQAFARYAIAYDGFVQEVIVKSKGVSYPAINPTELVCIEVPLPPSIEQHAIADYLDIETARIDKLIREKEGLIGLLREYRQSLIAEAVLKGLNPDVSFKPSGVPWLGEVPEHWEVKKVKFLAQLMGRKTDEVAASVRYVGLEHVEAGTGEFVADTGGMQTEAESTVNMFEAGCVLFGKLRPYLAKAVVTDTDGVCSSEFLVLRPTDMSAGYLKRCLLLDSVITTVNASTFGAKMPRADWTFISQLYLPQPPVAEQQAIADYLDAETVRIDELVTHTHAEINLLKELRTATIADAVLGRIDVRTQVRP